MRGDITFYWRCGYKKSFLLLTPLKGLLHNGQRPYMYTIDLDPQELEAYWAARFNRWMKTDVINTLAQTEMRRKDVYARCSECQGGPVANLWDEYTDALEEKASSE
jgi:hypothetical protein